MLSFISTLLVTTMLQARNPLIEMTAITGRPTRADVTELLEKYHAVGIEQFLIYPRSGLEIEYMSPEWMRFCRDCIEVADSLDMRVWLYDEYNYPSGNCKGQVTADGHENLYPKLLYFEKGTDGNYTTEITLNRTGADLLDPDAVARFIALTHERYYAEFGKYFGNVIPAIFTDEPSFNYSTTSAKGFHRMNFTTFDKDHFGLAWYDGLEEDYAEKYGRNFRDDVIGWLRGTDSPFLWTGYYTLVGERMRTTYIAALSEWCEAHGIHLTGHMMYEKLYKSVRCNGDILKILRMFGIPGFDEANSDIDIDAREMEVSGLALVQYASKGKEGAMCELNSVGPADLSLSIQRQMMWMCSCFGVNNYIIAVSAMDARGNKEKGDWYYSSGPTQPWFDHYREFGREAEKAATFARKPYTPSILVRVPLSYFMSLDKTPAFEQRGLEYLRFLEDLLRYQLQFELLDEDEDSRGLPVITFGPGGFSLEGERQWYEDHDEFVRHVTEVVPRKAVAYGPDGSETRNVLLRSYDDGCYVLVDLSDDDKADRLLTVRTSEGNGTVRLSGHGVFAGRLDDMRAFALTEIGDALYQIRDTVTYSPRILRCLHTSECPVFEFTLAKKTKGIKLLAREAVDPVQILLDGNPVSTLCTDTPLPFGFSKLYRSSRPMTLKKGRHSVTVSGTDWRYLPSAFLVGTDDMSDYVGTYDLIADIDVPSKEGLILSLDVNLACVEVLLDGETLGRRAWAPYEWDIPADTGAGRHTLTLRVSTSIMPMFGDLSKLEADQPYVDWMRIRPGQHGDKSRTGLFGARWLQR